MLGVGRTKNPNYNSEKQKNFSLEKGHFQRSGEHNKPDLYVPRIPSFHYTWIKKEKVI